MPVKTGSPDLDEFANALEEQLRIALAPYVGKRVDAGLIAHATETASEITDDLLAQWGVPFEEGV
jgi:hypothetical protein